MADPRLVNILSTIDLFDGLEDSQLESLADAGSLRRVAAGEILTEPGRVDEHLWAFFDGRLRIETDDGVAIRDVTEPRVLGEMGVLLGETRSSRVRAIEDVRLLEIPVADLESAVGADPTLGHGLLGNLCRLLYGRLHHANDDARALRQRLAELAPNDPLLG